jgi:hypothetical protein
MGDDHFDMGDDSIDMGYLVTVFAPPCLGKVLSAGAAAGIAAIEGLAILYTGLHASTAQHNLSCF